MHSLSTSFLLTILFAEGFSLIIAATAIAETGTPL